MILQKCPHLTELKSRSRSYERKDFLHLAEEPISSVLFVHSGIISHLIEMEDGRSAEVGLIGCEGVIGLEAALGVSETFGSALVQCSAQVTAVDVKELQRCLAKNDSLFQLLTQFALQMQRQAAQTGACSRLHPLEKRLARWLLMVDDRSGIATLPLTQDLIGQALGTRRSEVNISSRRLVLKGLIRQKRGRLTILNRPGLERAACECYPVLREQNRQWLDTLGLNSRSTG